MDQWIEMQKEGYLLLDSRLSKHWKLKCPQGHEFESTKFQVTKRGVRCGKCSGKDPETNFNKMKESIEAEGWKVLRADPKSYRRFNYKMLLQDPEGQQIEMTGDSWERGHRSVRGPISQVRNRSIESVKEEFTLAGYQCLEEEYRGAKHKMKAQCPEGHEFKIHYNHWQQGVRCPTCFGTPRKTDEEILNHPDFISSGYILLGRKKHGNKLNMVTQCPNQHEWGVSLFDFFNRGYRCPRCNPKSSRAELELLAKVQEHYPEAHKSSHLGFELDIFVPEKNFAIEYCGLYWHSSVYKDRNYHFHKYQKCREAGVKLYTIFEDEWLRRREVVLQRLLPPKETIFARKTDFVEISKKEAWAFEDAHHLQGRSPRSSSYHVGLKYKGSLVATMSFGAHHRNSKDYVLQRLTFSNVRVQGGVEKMLKNANLPQQPIITWSDNRWSWGEVYRKVGFVQTGVISPDYSYCTTGPGPERFSKQSLKKTEEERLTGKTELELRTEQGFYRVYDCGKIRWEYYLHLDS